MSESSASFQICILDQYSCKGVVDMYIERNRCDDEAQPGMPGKEPWLLTRSRSTLSK
jgi:hypothetical protein